MSAAEHRPPIFVIPTADNKNFSFVDDEKLAKGEGKRFIHKVPINVSEACSSLRIRLPTRRTRTESRLARYLMKKEIAYIGGLSLMATADVNASST